MENRKRIYLEGLNGVRAIAAMAVVISHITLHLSNFNLNPYIFGKFADGSPQGLLLAGYGVSMFFSLSGFLITYLLLLEKKEKSIINIRFFYIRRILRIWPLYYLFMIICLVAMYSSGSTVNSTTLLFYIFYAPNIPYILGTFIPVMAHYWSLGVEEQFYLFWPLVMSKVKKQLGVIICLAIIIMITIKLIARYYCPGQDKSFLFQFIHITRFHCMLIGALGAVLYEKRNILFMEIATSKGSQVVAWGVIITAAVNRFHIASVLDSEFVSGITVIIILGQVTKTNRLINLQTKIPDFLGKISYGMYIYHPLIIWFVSLLFVHIPINGILRYLLVYSSVIAITIVTAYLSFSYFEKWFLNLKIRYTIIDSSKQ